MICFANLVYGSVYMRTGRWLVVQIKKSRFVLMFHCYYLWLKRKYVYYVHIKLLRKLRVKYGSVQLLLRPV